MLSIEDIKHILYTIGTRMKTRSGKTQIIPQIPPKKKKQANKA